MRILFDPSFDSAVWPGPLAERDAVAGEAWAGPSYLLDLVETALGLGGPPLTHAMRAASIVPAVQATPGFWTRSAEIDPFQSALRLLRWRDALWMAGWRGEAVSDRLAELAAVTGAVLPGVPDRLAAVAAALAERTAGIEALELVAPVDDLAPAWRAVVHALEAQRTTVTTRTLAPAPAAGDLAAARARGFHAASDGSLQLVRPPGPLQAAEEVAAWLAAEDRLDGTVVIGAEPLLDAALHRHGLPTTGAPLALRDNALVQILPLVVAMGWSPPDPRRALELVTMPTSPVPRALAWRLTKALHEAPAVDSDQWRAALVDGLAEIDDPAYRARVGERVRTVFSARVSRGGAYPVREVRRRLDVLDQWIRGRLETSPSPAGAAGDALAVHHGAHARLAWEAAAMQSAALRKLLDQSGLETLAAPQLQRFLDQAMEHGIASAAYPAQAGLPAVRVPGAVAGPARRVVWWCFTRDTASFAPSLPLSALEAEALARLGLAVPDSGSLAIAAAERWRRPLFQATETLLLVAPLFDATGAEQHPHPLWDEIEANAAGAAKLGALVRDAPAARAAPRRSARPIRPLPERRRRWRVASGAIAGRDVESPSSLGLLLGCSLAWTLRYAGRVRGGATAALPAAEQMLGTVSHALLERVLAARPSTIAEAEAYALALFDGEGPRMAAALFLPGADAACADARQVVQLATRELFRHLRAAALDVIAVETTYAGAGAGGALEGRPDLVVGRRVDEAAATRTPTSPRGAAPAGDVRGVIDLKWSGAPYRRDELAAGTAYQLAAYSHLVRAADRDPFPPVAYYVLRDQRLLVSDARVFPTGEPVGDVPPEAIWRAVERAVARRRAEIAGGMLEAPGNADDERPICEASVLEGEALVLAPPCRFCEFSLLCGKPHDEITRR